MVQAISTGTFCEAKWVVDPTAGQGTHTTIASALTSASSGDTIFIRPGTYTENLTLKVGVNLAAYLADALTPNVTIVGKCTLTDAGTVSISGIRLQTNSDNFLAVTGSAASIVRLTDCYLNCTNNTGISFTTSSSSAQINIKSCLGDIGTTGIGFYSSSSAGSISFRYSQITNSGASTTASSNSAGLVQMNNSHFHAPISTTSTGAINVFPGSVIDCSAINNTALTANGTGGGSIYSSYISSGSASAISIGAGVSYGVHDNTISSTNTNAITGSGSISFSSLGFNNTSSTINTSTQTAGFFRPGILLNTKQPAFLAYLATTATDKTGNGASYQLGTDALTEVFDQNGDFNTNGTFTAPYTGKYQLNTNARAQGCTAATVITFTIQTSNRNYIYLTGRAASALDIGAAISELCDMDAADTAVVTIVVLGEAGNTDDITGGANVNSGFSGFLMG